ncbi:Uncharacterized protein TCM_004257 [Theobroma cacao]|uniref:Uncharacterized protein n=1 Tax=Theobroma cacao TaxID=3641 RepID=A0A061DX91_THECC|nr:Uncharacterized protein TCM_004257 [Theobroma cacao]
MHGAIRRVWSADPIHQCCGSNIEVENARKLRRMAITWYYYYQLGVVMTGDFCRQEITRKLRFKFQLQLL